MKFGKYYWMSFFIVMIPLWYWVVVMTIANDYSETGNRYGEQALLFMYEGRPQETDSCWTLFQHYIAKKEATKKWLPEFFRPGHEIIVPPLKELRK